jgi:endonuclease YncB( thermonuclease family)
VLCILWVTAVQARDPAFTNYDGDTFRATFRVSNIDAPEIKGKCEAERKLAQQAKVFTEQFLARENVTIKQNGVDQYGRILATVEAGGRDLGQALIAAGLARTWKGRRENWC